jgi:uncharacterized membrane protein YidH (DUF202 family)
MRYLCLALVSLGALMFPFAAKRILMGITTDDHPHDIRNAVILIIFGIALIAAGQILYMRDETTSVWRNRSRGTRRIRLR